MPDSARSRSSPRRRRASRRSPPAGAEAAGPGRKRIDVEAMAMSVVALERALPLDSEAPDAMPRGIAISAAMHVGLLVMIVIGLPTLFRPPVPEDQPIAVELVTIAPETHATKVNPNLPKPNAKP